MMEIVGHAPLLLGLLLNNQNNNNPAGINTNGGIYNGNASIVVTHEHVVEVLYPRGMQS